MPASHIPLSTRAVFFDAVGTLIFPAPGAPQVYADYARRHRVEIDAGTIRTRMAAAYAAEEEIDRAAAWITSESREIDRWRRIVTASLAELPDPAACFRELFDHFARPDAWTVNPDAHRVIAELTARGLTLGIGSNYDRRLSGVIEGQPELAELRDRVVISSVVRWRKPSECFFEEVVRVSGFSSGEVVFVGDDFSNDYLGASAAGLPAVLLDVNVRYPNAARVTSLSELLG